MRGRSKILIMRRDRKLLERWTYWTETRRLRFDDALSILSEEEFFLSEGRIMGILRQYPAGDMDVPEKTTTKICRNPLRKRVELDLFDNTKEGCR